MPKIEVKELPQVNADPDLLQRVFANLIGNAIKFTVDSKSGGIKVGGYRTTRELVCTCVITASVSIRLRRRGCSHPLCACTDRVSTVKGWG